MSFVLVLAVTGTASADQWDIAVPDAGFDDHVLSNMGDYIYIGDPAYTGAWKSVEGNAWIDYGYWAADIDMPARSGNFKAYPSDAEAFDHIYQILDETYIEGGTYTLSVWVGNAWPASGYADGWGLYFTAEDFKTDLAETHGLALSGEWEQISLVYTATAADAGKKIGIKMSGEQGESYIAFEDVTLSYDGPAANFRATNPIPADGALLMDTWVTLSWVPGGTAVLHDVYLGDDFDSINDGTRDSDVYRGNQTSTFYLAGFPGFPYPDGLVPGTTYYWRIDEVNDLDPNSPWKGNVWSFTVPPRTAYEPNPADGAKFIDPNADLSWTAGFGAKLHTVYFGDNFDDVNNATGGVPHGAATYTPGPLELEKVYYWRVDEFDAIATHKGDVWSFTTAGAGGGLKAEYYHHSGITPPNPPSMAFRTLVLTRTDPQINFNWGDPGSPDPSVKVDDFSARWTGNVEAAFTEAYTFYTNTDDGVMLWVDGQLLIDNWTDHAPTENRGTIDLVAGQQYSIEMWWYERGGGAVAELRWSSPRTPKQLIPQAALSLPVKALSPNPPNGATGVRMTATLSWRAGDNAASHQVYFGTDADAVRNATTASPEYKGSKALGSESYGPGKLAWFTTYYWRVDEANNVHPDSPWIGNIWSFTTGDFLVVDDFELYNDLNPEEEGSNRIFNTWIDGYDQPTNGSQIGYTDPPFCEQSIVHSGRQSMPLFYDNSGPAYYSEATLPLTYPRDWTEEGVKILTLWFYGDPANVAESMYVAVANATGPVAVVYHDNPDAALIDTWTDWNIDLTEFSNQGVVLTNVDSLSIGFGNRNNPQVGGSGMVFIDDIRLYRPPPEPEAE